MKAHFRKKIFSRELVFLAATVVLICLYFRPGVGERVIKSAQAQQNQQLTNVRIEPMELNTDVGYGASGLSALAYDQDNKPIWFGISYEWGISSTNPLGTLSPTEGPITSFLPLSRGRGSLWVIARQGDENRTLAIPVAVGPVGDVNGDGLVDEQDLLSVLAGYGLIGHESDVNGDGKSNAVDFGTVAEMISGGD